MAESKSLSWIRLQNPVQASELRKLSDSEGIFHVEFLVSLDEISEYVYSRGGGKEFFRYLVEDKLVKDLCKIDNLDFYPYEIENSLLVIRVTGEVISQKFYAVEVTYESTVSERIYDIEAGSAAEALELAKKKILKQRDYNESRKILGAEIVE